MWVYFCLYMFSKTYISTMDFELSRLQFSILRLHIDVTVTVWTDWKLYFLSFGYQIHRVHSVWYQKLFAEVWKWHVVLLKRYAVLKIRILSVIYRCLLWTAMLEDMQLSSNMAAVETIKKITVMEGENAQFSIWTSLKQCFEWTSRKKSKYRGICSDLAVVLNPGSRAFGTL